MALNVVKNILWKKRHFWSPVLISAGEKKKKSNSKKKKVHRQITRLLRLILATSFPQKTGNGSGCYQALRQAVAPVRRHRARLFPASLAVGSRDRIKQKGERDGKEKRDGGRKGRTKKRQASLSLTAKEI